jgi:hypothetical protein
MWLSQDSISLKPAITLATSLMLAACTVGSGTSATVERPVEGFDRIVLTTSGDVIVQVTGSEALQIEGDENILPLLTTDVQDGALILGSTRSFTTTVPITYTITADQLVGVDVSGSGDVEAVAIDTSTFAVSISGSGTVEPSGRCGTLSVEISGSGTFSGNELGCEIGQVTVSGSGDATVNASNVLDASVSGSGTIEYLGDPELRSHITGSGDIEQG